MFRKLLIPLDGTPESEVALTPARTLSSALSAQVVLIRVVPVPDRLLSGLTGKEAAEEASAYLERVAADLRGVGLAVEVVVVEGIDVADVIVEQARSRRADLIAMATHGRGGLGKLVIGSVPERVVAHSSVPVMLLRPTGHRMERLERILVPIDGSPGSLVAINLAAGLARETGAQILLLQVVVPVPLWEPDPTGLTTVPRVDLQWDEDRLASAVHYVERVVQRLVKQGYEAEGRALLGDVVPTITAEAVRERADLIVMSTHARQGPARVLLGSVTDEVVRNAREPVLLVNPESAFGAARAIPARAEHTHSMVR